MIRCHSDQSEESFYQIEWNFSIIGYFHNSGQKWLKGIPQGRRHSYNGAGYHARGWK